MKTFSLTRKSIPVLSFPMILYQIFELNSHPIDDLFLIIHF